MDQIKNPGVTLRKVDKSKHKENSNVSQNSTGLGSMQSALLGAMLNIRSFKRDSDFYNLEDETYRAWDSSDSN